MSKHGEPNTSGSAPALPIKSKFGPDPAGCESETIYKWAGVRFPSVDVSVADNTPPELLAKLSSLEEAIRLLTERLDVQARGNGTQPAGRPRRRPSS